MKLRQDAERLRNQSQGAAATTPAWNQNRLNQDRLNQDRLKMRMDPLRLELRGHTFDI